MQYATFIQIFTGNSTTHYLIYKWVTARQKRPYYTGHKRHRTIPDYWKKPPMKTTIFLLFRLKKNANKQPIRAFSKIILIF